MLSKSGDSICSEESFPCFVKRKWVLGFSAATRWGQNSGGSSSQLPHWAGPAHECLGTLGHFKSYFSLSWKRGWCSFSVPLWELRVGVWECLPQCSSCREHSHLLESLEDQEEASGVTHCPSLMKNTLNGKWPKLTVSASNPVMPSSAKSTWLLVSPSHKQRKLDCAQKIRL